MQLNAPLVRKVANTPDGRCPRMYAVVGVGLRTGVHDCRMLSASDGDRSPSLCLHLKCQSHAIVLCVSRLDGMVALVWPPADGLGSGCVAVGMGNGSARKPCAADRAIFY